MIEYHCYRLTDDLTANAAAAEDQRRWAERQARTHPDWPAPIVTVERHAGAYGVFAKICVPA